MAQYYEVEDVQETKLDDFKGSTWYSVKFKGVADNALWLAQKRPDANGKVYGHIERTASGKGWRFKRDPLPEDGQPMLVDQSTGETRPLQLGNEPTQLDRIEKKLDQLLGIDKELTTEPLPQAPADFGNEEGGY